MTDREAIRKLVHLVMHGTDSQMHEFQEELSAEPAAPTVTREQAEWVSDVIQTKWYDMRAKQDDEREAPPVRYEMPAFFRSAADALEGE